MLQIDDSTSLEAKTTIKEAKFVNKEQVRVLQELAVENT